MAKPTAKPTATATLEALKDSPYALAVNAGNAGVWEWDVRTGQMFIDPTLKTLLGMADDGGPDHFDNWRQRLHPDDQPKVLLAIDDHFNHLAPNYELQHRIIGKDGGIRWLLSRGTARRDSGDAVTHLAGISVDITDLKLSEESLRRDAIRLTLLAEVSQMFAEAGQSYESALRVIAETAACLLGDGGAVLLASDDKRQFPLVVCHHPADKADLTTLFTHAAYLIDPLRGLMQYVVQSEQAINISPVSAETLVEGGLTLHSLLAAPLRVEKQVIGVLAVTRHQPDHPYSLQDEVFLLEIADRAAMAVINAGRLQKVEGELAEHKRSEDQLRAIVQNMPVMMNAFDADWNLIVWNLESERVTGYTAEEIVGRKEALELLYPDVWYRNRIMAEWSERGSDFRDWEWELTCKDGSKRTILWSDISKHHPIPGWARWGIGVDITARKLAEEKLKYLSTHDALTGLYNRAYFEEEVSRFERSQRGPVSVVMADLNRLKYVNDHYGHTVGDMVLNNAAQTLQASLRAEDVIARVGGDEFAVLLPGADAGSAARVIQRVRHKLEAGRAADPEFAPSLALGAATAKRGHSLRQALREADRRMYEDKATQGTGREAQGKRGN